MWLDDEEETDGGGEASSSDLFNLFATCSEAGEEGVKKDASNKSEPAASQRMSIPLCSFIVVA